MIVVNNAAVVEDLVTSYELLALKASHQVIKDFRKKSGFLWVDRVDMDEVYSEAYEYLVRAAKTYDAEKDIHFSVYCRKVVRNGILKYLRDLKSPFVEISQTDYEKRVENGQYVGHSLFEEEFLYEETSFGIQIKMEEFMRDLTQIEVDVVRWLLEEKTQKQIAEDIQKKYQRSFTQPAISQMIRRIRRKFSEFF